jgi:hypothetical protein
MTYTIRCLHLDYDRPSEEAGELHRRCKALFTYDATLPAWQRDFCPYHRPSYRPSDHILTRDEVRVLNQQLGEAYRRMTMPEARDDGDGLSGEERAWAAARKRELIEQAKAAGVLGN